MACTKVLTMYQLHHTWTHLVLHSPLSLPLPIPGILSTGLIFPFTYVCTQYLHHVHPLTPFPHFLHSPTDTNLPSNLPSLGRTSLLLD
jgi:hypothetical protein